MNILRNDKGYRVGECHHRSKLTNQQVQEIRDLYAEWKSQGLRAGYDRLAYLYGCSMSTVRDIIKEKTRI